MRIVGWAKTSTLDYPGQLCTAVFTPGCNFCCAWCHNKNVWDPKDEIDSDTVLAFLETRKGLLDGVAVSGGEPTLQQDRLFAFAEKVKALGFLLKLDTNGSNPGLVEDMLKAGLIDYIAMDYKAPWHRYSEICGCEVSIRAIQKTLTLMLEAGIDYELRTTVLPQLGLKDLIQMCQEVPVLERYALQLFRPTDGSRNATRDASWIEDALPRLGLYQPNIISRA